MSVLYSKVGGGEERRGREQEREDGEAYIIAMTNVVYAVYHSSRVRYGEIMFFPQNNYLRIPSFRLTILLLRQSSKQSKQPCAFS
jgi:hypothetical protein